MAATPSTERDAAHRVRHRPGAPPLPELASEVISFLRVPTLREMTFPGP